MSERVLAWLPIILLAGLASAAAQPAGRPPSQYPDFYRLFQQHETEGFLTRVVLPNRLPVLIEEHPTAPLAAVVTTVQMEEVEADHPQFLDLLLKTEALTRRLDQSLRNRGGWSDWDADPPHIRIRTVLPGTEVLHAVEAHLQIWKLEAPEPDSALAPIAGRRLEDLRRRFPGSWGDLALSLFQSAPEAPGSAPGPAALRPELAALAISGSLRHEQVLRKLADLIPDLPVQEGGEEPATGPANSAPPDSFRYRIERGLPGSPMIVLSFPVPPDGHPDRFHLEAVREFLTEGDSAYLRLPREGEERRPFAIRSAFTRSRGTDLLVFALKPTEAQLERAQVRVLAALEVLGRTPIPPILVKRVQARLSTLHLSAQTTLAGRAESLGRFELEGDYRNRDRFPERIAEIGEADLRKAISRYLTPNRLGVIEALPAGGEPREFTPETFLETLRILIPAEAEKEAGFLESLQGEASPFRPPRYEQSFAEMELRRSSVLRGPEVFVRELHSAPVVDLAFLYPGGRVSESTSNAGITEALARALRINLARTGGGRSWLVVEAEGITLEGLVEQDYFGFRMQMPPRSLSSGFRQLMEWLKAGPQITEAELADALLELEAESWWDPSDCSPQRSLLERGRAAVYGSHPYAVAQTGCDRTLRISLADLASWQTGLMQRIYPHVFAVGAVNGTSFLQDQIPALSDRNFSPGRFSAPRPQYEDRGGSTEALPDGSARVSFAGPRTGSDDVEILDVALALLNGPAGRLNRGLTDAGIAGEAELVRETDVAGGALHFLVSAPPGQGSAAAEVAVARARRLVEGQVPEPEFLSALVRTITRYTARQQDRRDYLHQTMLAILAGEPMDYATRYVLNIRQMRMGEVETSSRRHFGEAP